MKDKYLQYLPAAFLVSLAFVAFFGYKYYTLAQNLEESRNTIASLEENIDILQKNFANISNENNLLSEALYIEQTKNEMFEDQIENLSDTVGDLEKLSKVDPEILQKYSKVYFLNEHYTPSSIAKIPPEYVLNTKEQWIHKEVGPFLGKMIKAAERDKIDLRIISAYRSFDEQASVKEGHVITYGAGTANQFSAEQGYSEHQLGTTIDLTTLELGTGYSQFDQTEAYEWMLKNAHKFGFVLSYPEGNQYYYFEPWHWRFVGIDLAERLHRENKNFYDMDQREIDKYLIRTFDD